MKAIKLGAMAEAYQDQMANIGAYMDLGFDERLAMLVDHESDVRAAKKVQRLVNGSGMFFKGASPEQINYSNGRKLNREQMASLLTCDYIDKKQSVIFTGPTAAGKTWLACAFGVAACRKHRTVRYYKMRQLIDELLISRSARDESYAKLMNGLRKTSLLIVDDFLLHEVNAADMGELLELVDARLLTGSTIFCSQYKHEGWIKIMGRTPISEAFMSRVRASAHVIDVDGPDDLRMAEPLS